jgi:uncharacterized protein YkwD
VPMPLPMALRHWHIGVLAPLALGLATLGLLAGAAPRASAASACSEWGDAKPQSLRPGEARKAIRCLINARRQNAGMRPLRADKRLQRAAQRHTDEMDGSGCFAHECPGESALGDRLEIVDYLRGGLTSWLAGENIAWGAGKRGTPKAIVDAWMNSPPHRANILNRSFRDLGVGFAVGSPHDGGDDGGLYTADFGLRVG